MDQTPETPETPDTTLESTSEAAETQPATDAEAALAKLVAMTGGDFNREQAEKLKEKLAKVKAAAEAAEGVTVGPDAKPEDVPKDADGKRPGIDRALTGKDIDWSEYNLDFNVAHLYPKAVYRNTPQGPKWCAMISDFISTSKDFRNYEKEVNVPGSVDGTEKEPLNLGLYLKDKINGRDGWTIAAVMPAASGQCGLLLERQVPIILPDPIRLKQEEEPAAPTDPALAGVEDAALEFATEIGQAPPETLDTEASVSDDNGEAAISLRPIEKGTIEHEQALAQTDDKGALAARSGAGILQALQTAAAETVAAPQADLVTPDPIANPLLGGAPNAAAGYDAAADVLKALAGPDFGSLKAE